MSSSVRIAVIGHAFMGKAHIHAWRTAGRFFDLPKTPEVTLLVGRDAGRAAIAAERLNVAESTADWRAAVTRDDIDVVDICTPEIRTARSPSPHLPRESMCCVRSPWRTPSERPRR